MEVTRFNGKIILWIAICSDPQDYNIEGDNCCVLNKHGVVQHSIQLPLGDYEIVSCTEYIREEEKAMVCPLYKDSGYPFERFDMEISFDYHLAMMGFKRHENVLIIREK